MKVPFVAGFGPSVPDQAAEASAGLYAGALGLSFQQGGSYDHADCLPGARHCALSALAEAAQSCFGTRDWPDTLPPQAWLEFDVDDREAATREREPQG